MKRRRYLATGGAAIGSGLAGCLGGDDSNGDGTESTEDDPGESEDSTSGVEFDDAFDGDFGSVAKWVPAPSVLDVEPYRVNSMAPAAMAEQEDHLDEETIESVATVFDELAIDALEPSDVDRLVSARYGSVVDPNAPSSLVLEGAVDAETAGSTLADAGYERVRSDEDYDYYDGDDAAYAVSDGVLIAALGAGTLEIVGGIVDAGTGRARRYSDDDEAIGDLVGTLPTGHVVFAGPTDSEESPIGPVRADGTVVQVSGERTYEGFVLVCESGAAVEEKAVEALIDENETLQALTDVEYGIDGPIVRVHGSRPTEEADL